MIDARTRVSARIALFAGASALLLILLALGVLVRAARVKVPEGPTPANEQEALETWGRVLETYVDDQGRVDFAGLSGDRGGIEAYLRWVARADTSGMSRDARLAFHINAYNALAMYGVARSSGIRDFGNLFKKVRFFVMPRHAIAGRRLSLYDFENAVIRKEGDARVHVALNCMASGCPRLPREPFRAEGLDGQLDHEARRFYGDGRNVRVDHANEAVLVSEILDLFTEDFLAEEPSLLAYVNAYREERVPEGYEVAFAPYDWTVNSQPRG